MKWVWRTLAGALLLVVLAVAVAGFLLGTEAGTRQLFDLARGRLPGTLTVERLQGHLLGRLEVQGLRYADSRGETTVGHLVLAWRPAELLERRLHLTTLTAAEIRHLASGPATGEEAEASASGPPQLPDIQLPVTLQIDQVALDDVRIRTAPKAQPLVLHSARLQARWDADGLQLQRLDAAAPQGRLALKGHLQPRGDYPLTFDIHWRLTDKQLPKVAGQGTLKGALGDALALAQTLSGELAGRLQAQAAKILQSPAWRLKLDLTKVPARLVPVELPADLRIHLQGRGDTRRAHLEGRLSGTARPDEPDAGLALALNGDLTFDKPAFDFKGDWTRIQWPLTGLPQVAAANGRFQAAGTPDDYRFSLTTDLSGLQIPQGHWQASGRGDTRSVRLDQLTGDTLDGRIQARGEAAWQPALAWQARITADQIDPGRFLPDWSGRLDLALTSQGRQTPDGRLSAHNRIERLEGRLHDQPVAGRGEIDLAGDSLEVRGLQLSSGSARLAADGRLGPRWDLNWTVAVPKVGDLLPDGRGAIQGQGRLTGSAEAPVVAGHLEVEKFQWAEYRIDQIQSRFDLSLDPRRPAHLDLRARGLALAGQLIEALTATLEGPLADQRLDLALTHPEGKLDLAARGALDPKAKRWRGRLARLDLRGEPLGHWRLERPAALDLSPQAIEVAPLCLADGSARACLSATRRGDQGQADLKLQGLDLERFADLLPPQIEHLTGRLDATARADLRPPYTARLQARLQPGELTYLDPQGKRVTLHHRNSRLDGRLDARRLEADWHLELDQHHSDGRVEIPRAPLEKDPRRAPLKGRVQLVVPDLSLVRAFVPDIQAIEGRVDLDLTLGGTLGEPLPRGRLRARADKIVIPRAGLKLQDLKIDVEDRDGRHLTLVGGVRSGPGSLDLEGRATLDPAKGWPARVHLKGERFQAADLPEAQVLISPDLTVENGPEHTRVRGLIRIPRALIQVEDLPPNIQKPSGDVVVLEDGRAPPPKPAASRRLDLDVRIELGNEVHFAGFGLNVDLGGKLAVHIKDGKLPTANGELKVLEGTFLAYGQRLTIEKGTIAWAGGPIANPLLKLEATRKVDDITVGVRVTGTAKRPKFTTFASDPDVTEKEAMTMLLTGQRSNDLTQASIYAGRQITPRLSVGVNLGGGEDGTEFVTRYKLRKNVTLEGTSSATRSGGSINYIFELE